MAKKNKNSSKGTVRKILYDISDRKSILFIVFFIIFVAKISLAVAPRVAGRITDYLSEMVKTGKTDDTWFIKQCLLLAVLYFIGYGIDFVVTKQMVNVSQNLLKKLRGKSQKKLNHLSLNYLDNHPIGDILSRLTNDMVSLSNGLESTIASIIGQVVLLISLFVAMFLTNWSLALIYLIVLPLGLLLMSYITRKTGKLFKEQSRIIGKMNGLISDTYVNHLLMKSYGCEENKATEFNSINDEFRKNYIKSRFFSGFVIPLSCIINNIAYIILCVVGGIFLIENKLTVGEFQAFIFYGNMVNSPLNTLSTSLNNIQNSVGSAARIYDFLEEEEEPKENPSKQLDVGSLRGDVRFEHVEFGYLPEKKLMSDVSFTAAPGTMSAIVGPSGAGKTTLINLLMRFYEIDGGHIYLDGIDTKELSRENLRKGFGMVLQDTWIFDGTIAENISYGKQDATREEIIEAAKKAQCDDFICKLPDGYDTHISEEHAGLSAGEKQLISIARTILSNPSILILDEATSQVDTRTEYKIVKAMEQLTKGRTTFMIAHRLFTIKNADQIIYMENGDIKEVGNHSQLMKLNGKYAKLYRNM